jgi:hypothetical protein
LAKISLCIRIEALIRAWHSCVQWLKFSSELAVFFVLAIAMVAQLLTALDADDVSIPDLVLSPSSVPTSSALEDANPSV